MKIAFITSGRFDKVATLKRATGMATPLTMAGHDITLFLEDHKSNRQKANKECPNANIIWHSSNLSARKERLIKQNSLKKLQPDLVWICALGFRNWVKKTNPLCRILVDHSELFSEVESSRSRKLAYRGIELFSCFQYDGHICASRYLENHFTELLEKFGKHPRVHYSPYAYHRNLETVNTEKAAELKKRFHGKKVILYLGSFREYYGFWDMLSTFQKLSERRDDFVAVLIGRGPEKSAGLKWIADNRLENYISIEGYIEENDLSAYFSTTHAFISPLRDTIQDWARCPSKLFMYLPFKRPIITCKIGEAKEIFKEQGYYYIPGDRDSLYNTIENVLNHDETMTVDPEKHTYYSRTNDFLNWIDQQLPYELNSPV